ncbi:MAG TPA: phosphonate C-P lyase system protein PhnL [Candidatus Elarobacter sp.]|nr:phosphonate C-P lyase system protein PhnL [Candidatus Elarobacter sp.]
MNELVMCLRGVTKSFTLHVQGGRVLPVLDGIDLDVRSGDGVALVGPSGTGKSTLLRCIYGNYGVDAGTVQVRDGDRIVDVAALAPHELAAVRSRALGYVSQFLRAVPRVAAIDVAADPLLALGVGVDEARDRVAALFERMLLPERLWPLSPTTFSGGEKQRVNLARTLVVSYPVLLLDEPTAALDARSRERVVGLLQERRAAGAALIGIYHDDAVRRRLADRFIAVERGKAA